MHAAWKILIGLLLTLPVAAFATGRVVGPPNTAFDPHPVAVPPGSPTSAPKTVPPSSRGETSVAATSGQESGAGSGPDRGESTELRKSVARPAASGSTSSPAQPGDRVSPSQENTETPSPSETETPDSTATDTPEETTSEAPEEEATPSPDDTATEPSEDTTTEPAEETSGDSANATEADA